MNDYTLINSNSKSSGFCIRRNSDQAYIPNDPNNSEYQIYLKWCSKGFTPENVTIDKIPDNLPKYCLQSDFLNLSNKLVSAMSDLQAQINSKLNAGSKCNLADETSGSSDLVYVTPMYQMYHKSSCKAWALFDASDNSLVNCYNIVSAVKNTNGLYTFMVGIPFKNSNYVVNVTAEIMDFNTFTYGLRHGSMSPNSFQISFTNPLGYFNPGCRIFISCYGDY